MDYFKERNQYTEELIPQVWSTLVYNEKKAELLIYDILVRSMESFADIYLELSDKPLIAILNNWTRNECNSFGTNAITLEQKEDDTLIIKCQYDMYKIKEDLKMISVDLFGTIDYENISKITHQNIEIPNDEFDELLNGIQKKKVPYINKEQK